jgi:hypothetical protein
MLCFSRSTARNRRSSTAAAQVAPIAQMSPQRPSKFLEQFSGPPCRPRLDAIAGGGLTKTLGIGPYVFAMVERVRMEICDSLGSPLLSEDVGSQNIAVDYTK